METLRCRIGDLAVSVGCYLPENTGNIVKIIASVGYQHWYGILGQTFVWTVESSLDRPLVYENTDGSLDTLLVGPVPDRFLIPIDTRIDLSYLTFDPAEEAIRHSERICALAAQKKLSQ